MLAQILGEAMSDDAKWEKFSWSWVRKMVGKGIPFSAMATPKKKSATKTPQRSKLSKKAKKAPAKPVKKAPAKPAKPAKKAPAKPAKKAVAKKSTATGTGAKGRPFPKKSAPAPTATAKPSKDAPSSAQGAKANNSKANPTGTASTSSANAANDGFQRRLLLPPPPKVERKSKHALKPLRDIPNPLVTDSENPWSKDELKEMKARLTKDLATYKQELASAEAQAAELLQDSSDGAGDDQADAGTKTFEREHELSLVYNAQDLVLQTELALARIAAGTYTKCELCGKPIGKARLQVFPRATLCMLCKQKEERR